VLLKVYARKPFNWRLSVSDEYEIKDGIIVTPGKFEGEPEWVLTLWDMVLGGMADESVHDGTTAYDAFRLDARTAVLTGYDVRPDAYVVLWSDSQGFVSHMLMTEDQLFACEGFDIEEPTNEYVLTSLDSFDDFPEYDSGL
jgi:hypothetical protein